VNKLNQTKENPASTEAIPLLKEILRWVKIGAIPLREILLQELKTDQDRLVYEFSDGENSTRDVEKGTGLDHVTVARLWKKWADVGIVEPSEKYQGRYRRVCSLRDLAIRVPKKQAVPPSPTSMGSEQATIEGGK
jgi:hypothetical protein